MTPKIVDLPQTRLIGLSLEMSLVNNRTAQLWGSFMPRRAEIQQVMGAELYSLQVYGKEIGEGEFSPHTRFVKWAGVAVSPQAKIPAGMEELQIPAGTYAVFLHKGTSADFSKTNQYIFQQWLPRSNYKLRNAPHFELLGEKYLGHTHPESEEEVWIPIE